jgi:hypothetical protein
MIKLKEQKWMGQVRRNAHKFWVGKPRVNRPLVIFRCRIIINEYQRKLLGERGFGSLFSG